MTAGRNIQVKRKYDKNNMDNLEIFHVLKLSMIIISIICAPIDLWHLHVYNRRKHVETRMLTYMIAKFILEKQQLNYCFMFSYYHIDFFLSKPLNKSLCLTVCLTLSPSFDLAEGKHGIIHFYWIYESDFFLKIPNTNAHLVYTLFCPTHSYICKTNIQ